MSRWASSSEVAVAKVRASPVRGCNDGSIHTSEQTSVITLAVKSLNSLCLTVGRPPVGQLRAWSTEKTLPHICICWEGELAASCISGTRHHGRLLFAEQNHVPVWAGLRAMRKRLSHCQVPWLVANVGVVMPSTQWQH